MPLSPETVQSLIDTAADDYTSALGDTALSQLSIALGIDLGRFKRQPPEYLSDLAYTFKRGKPREVGSVPEGLRTLAGIAIGYSRCAKLNLAPHPVSEQFEDRESTFALLIGASFANLNPIAARSICIDAKDVSDAERATAHLVIDAFEGSVRAEASELFETSVPDDEAAGLALLVEPLPMETLALYVYGDTGEPDARTQRLRDALVSCFDNDFITEEHSRIKTMYQSPMQEGLVALTALGRQHFATYFRNQVLQRPNLESGVAL